MNLLIRLKLIWFAFTAKNIMPVGCDYAVDPYGYWYCNSSKEWVETSKIKGILILKGSA